MFIWYFQKIGRRFRPRRKRRRRAESEGALPADWKPRDVSGHRECRSLDRIALSSSLSLSLFRGSIDGLNWVYQRVEWSDSSPSQTVEGLFSIFLKIFKLKSFPWVSSLGEMNFAYFCPWFTKFKFSFFGCNVRSPIRWPIFPFLTSQPTICCLHLFVSFVPPCISFLLMATCASWSLATDFQKIICFCQEPGIWSLTDGLAFPSLNTRREIPWKLLFQASPQIVCILLEDVWDDAHFPFVRDKKKA